jgi:O-antigen ligase
MFYLFPVLVEFFYERIIGRIFLKSDNYEITDSDNSEGFRFQVWKSIFNLVSKNPLTGSSYLGSYILKDVIVGSAHNQYFDILLRTGFIGFSAYLFLILKLIKFLFYKKKIFFWSFISVIIYGFFHETFKETQGAFILTFIIALYSNEKVKELKQT